MKKYIFVFIIYPSLLYSQADSLKDLLNYYPLENGDYWEYKSYFTEYPYPTSDSSFYSVEVKGDTIMNNRYQYKILLYNRIFPLGPQYFHFERLDSLTGCVYRYINDSTLNYEYLTDSLFAQPGDTIYSARERYTSFGFYRTVCVSVTDGSVFGIPTQLKEFYNQSAIPFENYTLAKGFGFLFTWACEFGCGVTSLTYAKINGKEYGNKITSVDNGENQVVPPSPMLYQNYPNPFNPSTTISFYLPVSQQVEMNIYNLLGMKIITLLKEYKQAGEHSIKFNNTILASGVYFYQLRAGKFVQSKKLIILK